MAELSNNITKDNLAPEADLAGKLALLRVAKDAVSSPLFTFGSLQAGLDLKGIEFRQPDGTYQPALENGVVKNGVVTDESIKHIAVEENGKTRYFEQVSRIDEHEGSKESGFKASVWIETDEKGAPKLNSNGKCEVTYYFQGYNGNPLESYDPTKGIDKRSPQTKALHQVGRGELSDQTKEVAAFIDATEKKLEPKLGGDVHSKIEAKVVGSSIGSVNALEAAVDLHKREVPITQTILLEPVAASLGVRLLGEKYGKDVLKQVVDNTVSVRTVADDTLSNCAHLKTHKGDETGHDRELAYETQRNNNNSIGLSGNPKERNTVDPDNQMVGKSFLVDLTGSARFGLVDAIHTLGSIVSGAARAVQEKFRIVEIKGENYEEGIATLKAARKEDDNKKKAKPDEKAQSSAQPLPPHLKAAMEEKRRSGHSVSGGAHLGTVTETQADGTKRNAGVPLDPPRTGPTRIV